MVHLLAWRILQKPEMLYLLDQDSLHLIAMHSVAFEEAQHQREAH